MNDVKLFLESCQSLVLYALVALSLGVLTISSAVALIKSVKISAVKICRYGLLGVFFMSAILGIGVSIGSVKVPGDPTNQVQQGQVSGRPLRRPGGWPPCQPSGLGVPLRSGCSQVQITDEDITNCWRVAQMREGCEIVGRDAFDSPQIHEDWLIRGGFIDVVRIPAVGWSFPWRDGFLEGITVFSDGGLRSALRTPYFPPPFEAPLAVVPSFNWNLLPGGVSNVFWHAVSPSNSLVVTWENSPVNRNVNCITNFQAEFFTDGRFAYRYQDHAVDYAPVFPFDWDGDGLENSVDPEPLVAGPDAHGTNVEWYNIVCSNVYEAAVSGEPLAMPALEGTISGPRDLAPPGIELVPRTSDVNTNAYYFVAVVVSRGPAPIYFTVDRKSRLGSPVVVARGGETNYVPLLMGVEYTVTSTVPLSVSAPSNAVAIMAGFNDGRAFNVRWPLNFEFEERFAVSGREYDISVGPVDPGGMFSWEAGCVPRLLSPGTECCCMARNGRTVVFSCSQSCSCRGDCGLKDFYVLENAMFDVSGGECRCGFDDPQPAAQPIYEPWGGASIAVEFDKSVIIFENAFEERPGKWRNRRSTRVRLTVSAYGGPLGGTMSLSTMNLGKLTPVGGQTVSLPPTLMLGPGEAFFSSGVYEGCEASGTAEDIEVSGLIMGNMEYLPSASVGKLTAVRAEVRPRKTAPENGCVNRHEFGVREIVDCECFPKLSGEQWSLTDSGEDDSSPKGNMRAESANWVLRCPLTNTTSRLELIHGNVTYRPIVTFVEPSDIVVHKTDYRFPALTPRYFGQAGDISLRFDLHVYPMTVSFEEIALVEVPWLQGGYVSGYYALPEQAAGRFHDEYHGAGRWHNVTNANFWAKDKVGCNVITNWSPGTKVWDIPIGWNMKNSTNGTSAVKNVAIYQARFDIDVEGTVRVEKFNHWVSRGLSTNPEGPENGRVILDGHERNVLEDFIRWEEERQNDQGDVIWLW